MGGKGNNIIGFRVNYSNIYTQTFWEIPSSLFSLGVNAESCFLGFGFVGVCGVIALLCGLNG